MKKKSLLTSIIVCIVTLCLAMLAGCSIVDGGGGGNGGGGGDSKPTVVQVESVTISKSELTLVEGESETLTATVKPDNATDKKVIWLSSNGDVISVSQDGVVTAIAAGTAKVTVKSTNGKTAECNVTVTAKQETQQPPVGHTHTYSDKWTTDENKHWHAATCEHTSEKSDEGAHTFNSSNKCTACGYEKQETQQPPVGHTHTYSDKWTSDESKHWHAATCDHTSEKSDEGTHTFGSNNKCTVCGREQTKYTVTFVSDGEPVEGETQSVYKGAFAIEPNGITKDGYTLTGWAIGSENGDKYEFTTPVTGNLTLYAVWEENEPEPDDNTPITYSYAGNECAAFEWTESDISKVNVEYRKSTENKYTAVDKQLIRDIGSGKARVDIVGLAGGVKYDFKITTSENKSYIKSGVEIAKHDRSGYAHFGKTDGVGAYKEDGTPKSNATIIYLTEANKNNVDGKGNSIAEYLASAKNNSNPIIIRVIGTVGSATWNTKTYSGYNKDNPLTAADFVNLTHGNGSLTLTTNSKKDYTQQQLIDGGFNTLNKKPTAYNGATCEPIDGLNSKIMCRQDSKTKVWNYDSIWNDCSISNVKNVTIEGIGEDALIFQWGFTFKNSSSIEVRNLHFDDYTEDACSFEGDESDVTELSAFKSGNIWLHHNTFDEGKNYWDVCDEQDKGDGDGSTDFKGLKNITIAYNHYIQTHKTNLIGGSDSVSTANVTFHHNYYESCNQRMPLGRQANMHMYNNYYSGSTLYSISLRAGAYAFIENCYFTEDASNHYPVELVKHDTYGTPSAKIINCSIDEDKANKHNGSGDGYLYIGNDRSHKMNNASTSSVTKQRFAPDFDTNSELFYYENGASKVEEMLTAEQVKTQIPKVAGVQKRNNNAAGGTTSGGETGGNESGGGEQTQSGTVIIFSDGAKTLVNGEPSSTLTGVTVTASADTTFKANKFVYNGTEYNNSYKLDSKGEVTVRLTETKEVTFCYYEYNNKPNPQISIGGETYGGGDGTTDSAVGGRYFTVKVTLQANTDYKIIRLNGVEIDLCYMIIG